MTDGGLQTPHWARVNTWKRAALFRQSTSFVHRTEPLQAKLIAVAFWGLAVVSLLDLRNLYLLGSPWVVAVVAKATMGFCVLAVGLVAARWAISGRKSGSLATLARTLGGTPGVLLIAAVASYLAIGVAVLGLDAFSQPGAAARLKFHVLRFGVLVAATVGGRAVLERIGADRLLRGVLVVLIASCAIVLFSPVLRDFGILAPYRIPFRRTGVFLEPNEAAFMACMTAALAAAFLTNGGPRRLGWLGLAAGVAAALGSASRTALVVLGVLAVVFVFINIRSRLIAIAVVSLSAGLFGIAGFVFSGAFAEWNWMRSDSTAAPETLFCDPADDPGADCAVLLAARDTLAGDISLNWSRSVPIHRWRGVTVDGPQGRVVSLELGGLGLNGRIPPELGRLDRLVTLFLARNRLTGPIPPELGNLASLEFLSLPFNALTGTVPPELAKLNNLRELWLRRNRLTGPVPTALGGLRNLSVLRLSGNDFDSIPPELSAVADNDLFGTQPCLPLPSESPALFDDCTTLLAVKDMLAGDAPLNWHAAIPIGQWEGVDVGGLPERVIRLDLSRKGLNGRIPPELASLDGLVSLNLADNSLTGPIPRELGQLSRPTSLWLWENDLAGTVPPEVWEVAENDPAQSLVCLPPPRTAPALFADCTTLLAMSSTLAGSVRLNWRVTSPMREWEGVTVGGPEGRVIALELPRWGLNGRLPAALGQMAGLRSLVLDGNALTGAVPPELGKLTDLEWLGLAANLLSGPVPPELANLSRLRELWLSGNRLTGSLPAELRDVARGESSCRAAPADNPALRADCAILLEARDILAGDMRLDWSEDIPIDLWQGVTVGGALERVTRLELPRSGLNGRVPAALGRLGQLVSLDLSGNRLTGEIPPALGALDRLASLRLDRSGLTGAVPPELEGLEELPNLRDYRSLGEARAVQTTVRRTNRDRPDGVRRLFCRPSSAGVSDLQADCGLLLASRDLLAGDAPLNWSEDIPIEFWTGVTVGGAPKRVTALELPRAGLNGHLVAELGELAGLVALDLSRNRLTGPVPPELEELASLAYLRLAGNDLTGPFPPALHEVADHDLDMPVFCRPRSADPRLLADCAHLLTVRDSLAGDAPLNWHRETPVDNWQGIAVDRRRGRVTALDLTQTGLNGRIPAALGQLGQLNSLRLGRNRLVGEIPPELGELGELRMLVLNDNLLSGSVPPELGNLSKLADLWLHGNRLIGPAPPSVTALPELVAFRLNDERAADELPPPDEGRSSVLDLDLPCRSFRTAAPRLHDDCAALLEARDALDRDGALNWSDTLPIAYWRGVTVSSVGNPAVADEAGEVPRVTALHLSRTRLNGRIPAELSALDALVTLHLGDNGLTGTIPPELGTLTGLRVLVLENNALTGEIPTELGALRALVSLRLGGNEITGEIPRELSTLTRLWVLALDNNFLTGTIDPRLGNLSGLGELRLENNRLHGTIPDRLGGRLAVLRLGGNAFSGCVRAASRASRTPRNDLDSSDLLCEASPWSKPPLFEDGARLMRIRDLLAGDAALNWSYDLPVASWEGVAVGPEGVQALDLRNRGLTGRIPPELGQLSHLWMLLLDGNRLGGTIPPELGNLTRLQILSLAGNRLTGTIPPELGNLLNLQQLWLADNRLTGSLPLELAGIRRVSLAVAGNEFRDCLPPEMRDLHSHDIGDGLVCTALLGGRPLLWRLGAEKVMEAPFLGHGWQTLRHLDGAPLTHADDEPDPHNLYIKLLGEAGIVPLVLFVSAIIFLLRTQWVAPRSLVRDVIATWILSIALFAMAFAHLFGLGAYMFLAGLSVATASARERDLRLTKT